MKLTDILIPDPLSGKPLLKLVREHSTPKTRDGRIRVVTKDMHVFKKVYTDNPFRRFSRVITTIANLVVPAGALIHVGHGVMKCWGRNMGDRKMRASKAFVHSLSNCEGWLRSHLTGEQTPGWWLGKAIRKENNTYSAHDSMFKYRAGVTVKPELGFSTRRDECASGIHFFVNLRDALDY